MNPLISRLLSNKHTTFAAVAYIIGAEVVPSLGAIWFPGHADQFKATSDKIKELALTYGFLMSGESSTTLHDGDQISMTGSPTGDTVMITKPQTKTP